MAKSTKFLSASFRQVVGAPSQHVVVARARTPPTRFQATWIVAAVTNYYKERSSPRNEYASRKAGSKEMANDRPLSLSGLVPPSGTHSGEEMSTTTMSSNGTEASTPEMSLKDLFREIDLLPPDLKFGSLLKALREKRKVSQSKLAEKAEYDHSYFSRLESGARMPTRDAVDRIAGTLEVSPLEHDKMLSVAGFMPNDLANLLEDEDPDVSDVRDFLRNEAIPSEIRDVTRLLLRNAALMGRIAAGANISR